jgi:uncharacterized membrane protein YccF (DUF307 family)
VLSFILNILWIIFGGGILIFLEYLLGGVVLCLTVIGIPFGLQCFKIAKLGLLPFGTDFREVDKHWASGTLGLLLNIVWVIVAGIWIFISHVVLAVGLAVTIIGIPFAYQHMKLAFLALFPFGKQVV